jgi:hypothetical protein
MLRRGKHSQHAGPMAIGVIPPSSAEDALTILRQHRQVANGVSD